MKVQNLYYLLIGSFGVITGFFFVSAAPRGNRYSTASYTQYSNNGLSTTGSAYQYRAAQPGFPQYSASQFGSSPSTSSQYGNPHSPMPQYGSSVNSNSQYGASSSGTSSYGGTSNPSGSYVASSYGTGGSQYGYPNSRYSNGNSYASSTGGHDTNQGSSETITLPPQSVVAGTDSAALAANETSRVIAWLNETSLSSESRETEVDPIKDANVNCSDAKPFPDTEFSIYNDISKVYTKPTLLDKKSLFYPMGFTKYVRVFGIPLLGTNEVDDSKLSHAAKLLAEYIDNDKDGIPDNVASLTKLLNYTVILGFLGGSSESEFFWNERYLKVASAPFREQFVCNIHFFEQWNSEVVPSFYKHLNDTDKCRQRSMIDFDWTLWYFPFTLTYYGYFDIMSNKTKAAIELAMKKASSSEIFQPKYPDDEEMEMAEFFAWSLITTLSALNCSCESKEIQEFWKICTSKDLYDFDKNWYEALDKISFLSKILPSGNYSTSATVQSGSGMNHTIETELSQISTSNNTALLSEGESNEHSYNSATEDEASNVR